MARLFDDIEGEKKEGGGGRGRAKSVDVFFTIPGEFSFDRVASLVCRVSHRPETRFSRRTRQVNNVFGWALPRRKKNPVHARRHGRKKKKRSQRNSNTPLAIVRVIRSSRPLVARSTRLFPLRTISVLPFFFPFSCRRVPVVTIEIIEFFPGIGLDFFYAARCRPFFFPKPGVVVFFPTLCLASVSLFFSCDA